MMSESNLAVTLFAVLAIGGSALSVAATPSFWAANDGRQIEIAFSADDSCPAGACSIALKTEAGGPASLVHTVR